MHWHNEFELNYIISGRSEFTCGEDKFIADAGDIIVVPPNMLHALYPYAHDAQVYNTLVFREELLGIGKEERCGISCIEPIVNGNRRIVMPVSKRNEAYEKIRECVEQIFICVKDNTPIADLYMKSELLRFLWLLEQSDCIVTVKNQDERQIESLREILVFINLNYRENINIDRLAQLAHLSKSYFMYRFKKTVGVSAMEYIIQLRIKLACEMLRNSGEPSLEIAFASGFQNLSNFNRQFKKYVGCTPKQYRESMEVKYDGRK
nr:AraC family transcriptional regulator [Parablautia muri]